MKFALPLFPHHTYIICQVDILCNRCGSTILGLGCCSNNIVSSAERPQFRLVHRLGDGQPLVLVVDVAKLVGVWLGVNQILVVVRIGAVLGVEVVGQAGVNRCVVGCFALCGGETQSLARGAGDESVEFGVGEDRRGYDIGCFHCFLLLLVFHVTVNL